MNWSVRTRIAVACLLCAVVPLIAYATYTYLRASSTLRSEEHKRFVEREVAVARALDDLTVAELQAIGAYARWTRFADAVRDGDNQWLRGQLETLASGSGGTAQVFSTNGQLLLASGRQLPSTALWRLPEVQNIVNGIIIDMPASGFETVDGRLAIVTAEYVAPPGRTDDKVGLLVISRPVDGRALAEVEAATDVRVSVVQPRVADALTGDLATDASSGVLNQVGAPFDEGGDRSVYLAVFDVDGYRSGVVKMAMDRSSIQSATSDLRRMALVALLLAILAATVAALLLSRQISRPLDRLAAAAVAMADGETRQRIEAGGAGEVGRLAGAFNVMSERVTERVADLTARLGSLRSEVADLNLMVGRTLLDRVDLDTELGHMLPGAAGAADASAACLFLEGDDGLVLTGPVAAPLDGPADADSLEAGSATVCGSPAVTALAERVVATGSPAQEEVEGHQIAAASLSPGGRSGALVVARPGPAFDDEETAVLDMLAGQVSVAVGNADAWQQLEAGYLTTVAALAGAIEVKDEYPQSHPKDVAAVCDLLADRLGVEGDERRLLRYGAILHDVGKMGVSERILRKPSPLTGEERALVSGHTLLGERIVAEIDYLRPAAPVVRSAHERWDGGGYPDGRAAAEIPRASRIVFLADAYCAMTADRPYRPALSPEAVLDEIARNAGKQFDPDAVAVLLDSADVVAVAAGGSVRRGGAERVLTTVLFVDLVDSTVRAAELGDEAWRVELGRFRSLVSSRLREHRGTQIDAVGDGVFARFDGAARAVRCALGISRDVEALDLCVRAGCHSGEVEVVDGEVKGLAVHIGARVAGIARPGEVLVSSTVKELVAGSGLVFTDRGEHELKGVPGVCRVYAAVG